MNPQVHIGDLCALRWAKAVMVPAMYTSPPPQLIGKAPDQRLRQTSAADTDLTSQSAVSAEVARAAAARVQHVEGRSVAGGVEKAPLTTARRTQVRGEVLGVKRERLARDVHALQLRDGHPSRLGSQPHRAVQHDDHTEGSHRRRTLEPYVTVSEDQSNSSQCVGEK